MKKIFFYLITITAIAISACNNGDKKDEAVAHDMNNMSNTSMQPATVSNDSAIKAVAITFNNVDAKAAAVIKEIVDHYLHIKNALANDNSGDAASGGKEMEAAIGKMDKSLLTAEQKKVFDDVTDDLKEHAEHIGKNGDKIEHQREHFAMMSGVIYDLVKAFGAGRTVYHDHCPMYNEKDGGAMWLSEVKEVKNPYLGAKMPDCGSVMEVIK